MQDKFCGPGHPDNVTRTKEEQKMFARAYKVMYSCYASITATTVVQYKDLPSNVPLDQAKAYDKTHETVRKYSGWCAHRFSHQLLVVHHVTTRIPCLPGAPLNKPLAKL